jgi:CheY-like chemotaxis protein
LALEGCNPKVTGARRCVYRVAGSEHAVAPRETQSASVAWGGDPDLSALLCEAIDRVASPTARTALVTRALDMAGCATLPADVSLLLAFVGGPLQRCAHIALGEQAAVALVSDVVPLLERVRRIRASAPPASSSPPQPSEPPPAELPFAPAPASGAAPAPSPPSSRTLRPSAPRPASERVDHGTLPYVDTSSGRAFVLVVDDDAAFLRGVSRLLRAAGHDVVSAPDGGSGLRICERLHPALVITDLDMPPPNGVELAAAIAARLGPAAPPVVLLTGTPQRPKNVPGVAQVLSKAIRPADLLAAIEPYLVSPPTT